MAWALHTTKASESWHIEPQGDGRYYTVLVTVKNEDGNKQFAGEQVLRSFQVDSYALRQFAYDILDNIPAMGRRTFNEPIETRYKKLSEHGDYDWG